MDIQTQPSHDDQKSTKPINSDNVTCENIDGNNIPTKLNIVPLIDVGGFNITSYKSTDIVKLKQKYISKLTSENPINYEKLNKKVSTSDKTVAKSDSVKKKKRRRVNRRSDPEVNNISNLLHCALSIESPEKNVENSGQNGTQNNYIEESEKNDIQKIAEKSIENTTKMNKIPIDKGDTPENEIFSNESPAKDGAATDKKNVFQFMMDSRNRSIGTNSPGRERSDEPIDKSEQVVQKEKLRGRKLLLQDWAEKQGGSKRKIEENAKDKYIEHTLNKRAKRMKKMLSVKTDPAALSKNSAVREDDTETIRKPARKPKVLSESEESQDATEISNEKSEELMKSLPLELEEDVIFSPTRIKTSLTVDTEENHSNDDVLLSPSLKKTSLLHYFDVKSNKNSPSNLQSPKNYESENISSVIKVKLNFTPKKTKKDQSLLEESLTVSEKSKKIKKKHRNSLSLRKNKEKDDNKVSNEEETKINKENDPLIEKQDKSNDIKNKLKLSTKKTKANNNESSNNIKKSIDKDPILKKEDSFMKEAKGNSRKNKTKEKIDKEDNAYKIVSSNDAPTKLTLSLKKSKEQDECLGNKLDSKGNKTPSSKKSQTPRSWKMKLKLVDKTADEDNQSKEENQIEDVETIICDDFDDEIFPLKQTELSEGKVKQSVKLAPLFLMSKKADVLAANEAKKKFLHSGVPSKMKNLIKKPPSNLTTEFLDVEYFPQISHIQQRDHSEMDLWDLPNTSLVLPELEDTPTIHDFSCGFLGSFTSCTVPPSIPYRRAVTHSPPGVLPNLKYLVKQLKLANPEYPVYKVFRQLREKCGPRFKPLDTTISTVSTDSDSQPVKKKRGRPKKKKAIDESIEIINLDDSGLALSSATSAVDVSMWTEKYKPQTSEEIIGNHTTIQELKSWLQSWVEYSTEQRPNIKRKKRFNSNSSDDFCSDSDTRDTDIIPQNTTILVGPHGSGKSSTVYALSNQLGINVIEINASSKRPGKKILSELQEATKSHQVKNTDTTSVNNFFQKLNSNDFDYDSKKLTLLLVEDADIVFEDQDEGFLSALVTLIASSKRPIIITSSDDNCAHLQKLMALHKVLVFAPFSPKQLGIWLQLLCFVEGINVDGAPLSRLLEWNLGDIRKTLLQLQFWVLSGGDPHGYQSNMLSDKQMAAAVNIECNDENSNLSWMLEEESQDLSGSEVDKVHSTCIDCFISYYEKDSDGYQLPFPINLGTIWGRIPKICGMEGSEEILNKTTDTSSPILFCTQVSANTKPNLEELRLLGDVLDSLALADVVYTKLKITESEPYEDYWRTPPVDSLSLNENKSYYRSSDATTLELTHWLVENNLKRFSPDSSVVFSEIHKQDKRTCLERLAELVPACNQADRSAICTDYVPALRGICRSEKLRCVDSGRRNNRFYHYLRSLGTQLSDRDTRDACAAFNLT